MKDTSGFQAGCGKLCRARLAGKARHARIRGRRLKAEGRKLRTQNSELITADRFLYEQQDQFGTGAWHLLHIHDLIALFTDINTKREKVPDTIFMPYPKVGDHSEWKQRATNPFTGGRL